MRNPDFGFRIGRAVHGASAPRRGERLNPQSAIRNPQFVPAAAWLALLLSACGALAGTAPEAPPAPPVLIRAELFAREGADILYAIGNVRMERGDALITCDAAVLWTADREAYLEGHVLYRTGKSVLEAERAYVRWESVKDEKGSEKSVVNHGFMFNAVVHWSERPDRITWHIRAEEVLQTDVRHFFARGSLVMSPCQFAEPHVFFQATEVELVTDEKIVATDVAYFIRGVSLPPFWLPPIYWPKLYIPLGWEFPQIRLQAGSSSRLGFMVRSEIIYKLPERVVLHFPFVPDPIELETQVGVNLDYFAKRGFAYGGSFEYKMVEPRRDPEAVLGRDLFRGRLEGYRVPSDSGADYKRFELGTDDRYRVKFVHSQDIPEGFELDVEYQALSDAGFLPEYFQRDYLAEKPIENRIYARYAQGPFAGYFHVRWQPEDWIDTTEYLPQIGFNVFSFPLVGNLLYTGNFEVANIRRRLSNLRLQPGQSPGDPVYDDLRRELNFFWEDPYDPDNPVHPLMSTPQEYMSDGRRLLRFNMYHQISYPFHVSIFDIEPFVGYRGTYYSETLDGGSGYRSAVVYGGRISTQFWRSWDDVRVHRPLLDIDGIRHVVTPEIRFLAIGKPSLEADELILTDDTDLYQPPRDARYAFPLRRYRPLDPVGFAFGDVDQVYPVRLVSVGLRNRWQTRRGGDVADLLDINAHATFYSGDEANFGKSRGDFHVTTRFRPLANVFLFSDVGRKACGIYDVPATGYEQRTDGPYPDEFKDVFFFNSGLAIEVSDRWAFVLSQQYEAGYSNHWAVHVIHQISNKWRLDVQYEMDTQRGYSNDFSFRLTRDLHDWVVEFALAQSTSGLSNLIGVSISPKGRRQLISGLEYTRDLRAGLDAHFREVYQHYDY